MTPPTSSLAAQATPPAQTAPADAPARRAGTLLPLPFVEAPADTTIDLPHITWHPEWRPVLERFVASVPSMGPYLNLNYPRPQPELTPEGADPDDILLPYVGKPETCTMHLLPSQIQDSGLRRDMLAFASALFEYDLQGELEGEVLTRALVGEEGGFGMKHLFAFLRAALIDITGQRLSAHVIETHGAGLEDNFPPHADMWITSLLLNLFNVSTPGEGVSTMLRIDRAWDTIAASGIPEEGLAQMQRVLNDAGACDFYMQFNGWMYNDHPWSEDLARELLALSEQWEMKPGQGYLVNDRKWMHGRLSLRWPEHITEEQKTHRLYRLGYNNRRLQELAEQRETDWEQIGYYATDCVGGVFA